MQSQRAPHAFFNLVGRLPIHRTELFQEEQNNCAQKQEPHNDGDKRRTAGERANQRCDRAHIDAEEVGIGEHDEQLFNHSAFGEDEEKQILPYVCGKEADEESKSPWQGYPGCDRQQNKLHKPPTSPYKDRNAL